MTAPLTVVSFAWSGARPIYGPWTTNNHARMVRRHLTVPHRYVCITDRPDDPEFECETVPLWELPPVDGTKAHWLINYVRLRLFDPWAHEAIGERILCLDQDMVIQRNIDDLVAQDVPFRILKLRKRQQVQAGMFLVRPGEVEPNPWAACFDPDVIDRSRRWVGSDQAVLSELFYERVVAGEISTWSEDDGIVVNDYRADWRILLRTGERKCWHDGAPEQWRYYREAGLPPPHHHPPAAYEAVEALDRATASIAALPVEGLSIPKRRRQKEALKTLDAMRQSIERLYLRDGVKH